jgi:nicotinamidase-related amidase
MGRERVDMSQDDDRTPYIPDVVPADDRAYYEDERRYANRVGWGDRPAVLIVDMTLAFTEEADDGQACIDANERLLAAARDAGVPIYYMTPTPAGTYPDGYPVTTKASPASDRGPDRSGGGDRSGWLAKLDTIAPPLEPRRDEIVIEKPRASAFFDTHLSNLLHGMGVDTLVIAGMTTGGCIRASAVDSHSSNFRTIVPMECTADPSGISHEVALFDLDMKYADVTPLPAVIERLSTYAATGDANQA